MQVQKIKTSDLAHLSYLVIVNNEAAVIDPRRDCEIYLLQAQKQGANIKYIFETHRNEDLVTGSRELSRYTDAPIYHGPGLDFKFGETVRDGQIFKLGDTILEVLETPGHTPESISIALFAEEDHERAIGVFTGDALFVNEVGRTDFFKDQLNEYAELLYRSLHEKIIPLGDQAIIYPAHGGGSVCGAGIADREFSTIGHERQFNPKLQLSKSEFIRAKSKEKHLMPPYFHRMEEINLTGDDRPLKNYSTLDFYSVDEIKDLTLTDQVVDIREPEAFLGCHIPNTISIPKDMLGAYAGYFLDYDKEIYFVCDNIGSAKDAAITLQRMGYDRVKGVLSGGMSAWETSGEKIESLQCLDVHDIRDEKKRKGTLLLDVRAPSEWEKGTIKGARTLFLGDLPHNLSELSQDYHIVTYCGSGKRSNIAASILQKNNFKKVSVFMGSYQAYTD